MSFYYDSGFSNMTDNFTTSSIIRQPVLVFLFLLGLGFACYGIVLDGPFIFDDEHFIQKNEYVHNADWGQIFTTSVTEGANIEGNFYRPLQQSIYALLYGLFGEDPLPFHFLQILIHIGNAFLLWLLLLRLSLPAWGALAGAALFLCHPVQTEAVSYISGLAGPLGFLFVLASLHMLWQLIHSSSRQTIVWLIASLLFFIIALFSKENMVVLLPIAIFLTLYCWLKNRLVNPNMTLTAIGLFALVAGVYMYFRFTTFNFEGSEVGLTEQKSLYTNNLWVRVTTFTNVIRDYLRLIFFPQDLYYEKQYTAYTSLLYARALPGLFLILATVGSIIAMLVWRKFLEVGLGLGWFMSALAPYSGIVPLNAMYLEHWLYIPLAGLAMPIASLFRWPAGKYAKIALGGIVIIGLTAFSARTIERNTEWADYEAFYLNELNYTDRSARIYNNLAMYYADKQNDEKAINYYKKAIQTHDRYPQPHHNLARIYAEQGKMEQAMAEYRQALKLKPDFVYSLRNLYKIFKQRGDKQKAEQIAQLIQQIRKGQKIRYEDIEPILEARP
ncbi:MAG: hypothetical protein BRD50_06995 [Bacteroidetes bacterium SW_11_45_7]|nr:MAG: hypothetical protein BRD50_06995 [Bacteroidetes bacterium SW_11_45_7]